MSKAIKVPKPQSESSQSDVDLLSESGNDVDSSVPDSLEASVKNRDSIVSTASNSSIKPQSFLSVGSSTKGHLNGSLYVPGNLELIESGISLNATSSSPTAPIPSSYEPAAGNNDIFTKQRLHQSNSSSLDSSRAQSQHGGSARPKPHKTSFHTEEHTNSGEFQRGATSSEYSVSIRYVPGKNVDPLTHDGWTGPPSERNSIVTRTKGRRTVYLFKETDIILFDKVARWKALHPKKVMEEAWDELVSQTPNGRLTPMDGIIQIVYGVRRYDYILKFKSTADGANDLHRATFEAKLLKKGLLVERETSVEDASEVFVKILCPFHVLCTEAQVMKLKLPLKVDEAYKNRIQKEKSQSMPSVGNKPSIFRHLWSLIKPVFEDDLRLDQQSAIFNRNRLSNFEGGDLNDYSPRYVQAHFFRDSHRSLLIYRMITSVEIPIKGFLSKSHREGVRYLLSEGIYTAMFHLHDDLEDPNCPENLRLFLKREWALRYFAYQPLDQISSYFGEKVALYFAFNGFYNLWLVSAVAVGLLVCFYGLGEASSGTTFRWAVLFDNSLTPWYGVFNSLWAMLMPSVWNRQANYLTWKWSTYDFEKEESKRPEFKATMTKRSEVTGRNELYFPAIKRRGRQIVSCLVIAIWVAVMAVFISFQISLGAYVSPSVNNDIWIACFTSFLGLASIFIMQVPFSIAVRWLNAWENYPTDTTYDDSFILKTYIFDFANSYSQPVYYSIVKPAFLSQDLFGLRFLNDSCSLQPQTENGSTCASGFTINLFVLFIGGQVVDRFQELCLPWIIARFLAIKASIKRRSRRLEERQRKRVAPMDITEDEGKPKVSEKATVLALSIDTLDDAVVSGRPSAYQRSVTKVKDNSNSAFLFGTSFKDMAAMVVDVVAGPTDVNGTADTGGENTRLPQYYRDDKLPEYRGVRDEYAQKIVQFGYVAMFVSINPLAPLFALLNNCYELRADAYKVLIMHQRPLPSRAQDIGSWEAILRFTARMSVATNSVQIAFTSAAFYGSFLAWLPSVGARMAARVGFIIAFHYAVYFITAILQWLIPEVPESVKLAMARTSYLDRLQRDQDVEVEDEFLSNPSLYSEKNVSEKRFDSQTTHEQLEARFFSALN